VVKKVLVKSHHLSKDLKEEIEQEVPLSRKIILQVEETASAKTLRQDCPWHAKQMTKLWGGVKEGDYKKRGEKALGRGRWGTLQVTKGPGVP